jgi:para-nitrobenzyl esterase
MKPNNQPSLRIAAAALTLCALIAAHAQIPEDHFVLKPIPSIAVDGGKIVGKVTSDGVQAWLGVPYAAPPINDLRWKEPQPVPAWQGVFNADRLAPECIQPLRPRLNNHYFGSPGTNEDCLYLNIWTPATAKAGAKLPVIVWIYGGGNTIGSASVALYDGSNIAKHGAILVSMNYRVGILGYMAHPELTAESPHHQSGNYGGLDQVAALQWVQRNIAKFGGDAAHVVIMGQSAGGGAVSNLQNSPLGKGLFSGAMGMSGGSWGGPGGAATLATAEKTGLLVQSTLKLNSLADLRNVTADRILALQEDCQLGCTNGNIRVGGANIDGYFLTGTPAQTFAAHKQNDVPVIVGFANDESRNDLSQAKTVAEYKAAAQKLYGPNADKFLALYPVSTDAEVKIAGHDAARDAGMASSMRNWAVAQAKWGTQPVYMYDLVRIQPFNPAVQMADHPEQVGSYHNSDTPYFLGTLDALTIFRPTRIWTPADRALSEKMTLSLITFARTGNPTTPDVKWPAWTPQNENRIAFNTSITVEKVNTNRMDFHLTTKPTGGPRPAGLATGARD